MFIRQLIGHTISFPLNLNHTVQTITLDPCEGRQFYHSCGTAPSMCATNADAEEKYTSSIRLGFGGMAVLLIIII